MGPGMRARRRRRPRPSPSPEPAPDALLKVPGREPRAWLRGRSRGCACGGRYNVTVTALLLTLLRRVAPGDSADFIAELAGPHGEPRI